MIRRPSEIIGDQNRFDNNEVGLTHPKTTGFIKLADNGDTYIMLNPSCGIVMNAARQSITFIGDRIKFVTKDDEGLCWNELAFNAKASKYSEPTFIIPRQPYSSIYDDIDQFVE
jgi:hypothetical protein